MTHAALSLAEALGAESTLLAGADFSYPEGKSYARGTYIYGYFGQSQSRLAPLEALFSGFLFRGSDMEREIGERPVGRDLFALPDQAPHGLPRAPRALRRPLARWRSCRSRARA